MSVINSTPLIAAGDDGGYTISRSVRLRSSASAYLNRTYGTATTQNTFTLSFWMKRGKLSSFQTTFGATNVNFDGLSINSSDQIVIYANNIAALTTTAVYRDPAAWYHIVLSHSNTSNTLYVNGVSAGTGTFSLPIINTAISHAIGQNGGGNYFDGYLTEINFIDGQALTPSSFGETDSITGVWKPKRYAGTYGTNGFYLNFADNSNNTAATIGKDSSGNSNNWTPNNISVTTGATYDSMLDTPTPYADGGNGRANYAVLNPINHVSTYSFPLANGNLTASGSSASNYLHALSSIWFDVTDSAGYYFEFDTLANYYSGGGLTSQTNITSNIRALTNGGVAGYTWAIVLFGPNVYSYNNGSGSYSTTSCTAASGTVIGCFVRGGKVWFRDSAGWLTGDPNTDTSPRYSGLTGTYAFCMTYEPSGTGTNNANFGQRPFAYTPPTGFKALNTQNLPDATIKAGNKFMDVSLWTGNGSSQSIVNSGAMQPDLVWTKGRSGVSNHSLVDSVRGIALQLSSNQTVAEVSDATEITALNSNGFSVGNSSGAGYSTNANGTTYVGWQWKESVSAGFDIVTYTFSTGGTNTVNHSLGVAPKFIIMKDRTAAYNWDVYHASVGYTQRLILNSTGAATSGFWAASPTSTQFSVTSAAYNNNDLVVAYLFAEVAGFSKFGSYTGNGSADGPFVYLGFRPRYVMIKRTDSSESWEMYDTTRSAYNTAVELLEANQSLAESTSSNNAFDVLSNGFKLRGTRTATNASGGTYIYAAFAENPFKNSLAR